jgi:hypothetical protein
MGERVDQAEPGMIPSKIQDCECDKAIAGEKRTNWRRIRLRDAATSMPDEKTSRVVCFSTEIA